MLMFEWHRKLANVSLARDIELRYRGHDFKLRSRDMISAHNTGSRSNTNKEIRKRHPHRPLNNTVHLCLGTLSLEVSVFLAFLLILQPGISFVFTILHYKSKINDQE